MTREEAIELIHDIQTDAVYSILPEEKEALDMAISALSENKGEWIVYDHGMGLVYLKCPFCGATNNKRFVEHNFCGKCGADMRGE